jgi:hypothetical protein
LFVRDQGTWTQQAYLKGPATDPGDAVGVSLALEGDTLVVGASGEDSALTGATDWGDDSAQNAGAVYVFTRSAGAWSHDAYVKASNPCAPDDFGATVALSGNLLAVGASREESTSVGVNEDQGNDDAPSAGAAYLYELVGNAWTQRAYIKGSNTEEADRFGYSVALTQTTLAVGALEEEGGGSGIGADEADNTAPDAGAVYTFGL